MSAWTTTPPTEPGFYWAWRTSEHFDPEPVCLTVVGLFHLCGVGQAMSPTMMAGWEFWPDRILSPEEWE